MTGPSRVPLSNPSRIRGVPSIMRISPAAAYLTLMAIGGAACASPTPPAASTKPDPHRSAGSSGGSTATPRKTASAVEARSTPATVPATPRCGALDCRLHESVAAALKPLLETDLQVIAFGEAHAQRGTEGIPSTARRFTSDLLPLFAGRSHDIVLELMLPNPECQEKEAEVVQRQEEVTRPQAESNQNEYVVLAQQAKELGIRPHVLYPTCEQYEAILDAGAGDIDMMLAMTAELTERKVKALLGRNAMQGTPGLVLTYGGLMHNDLEPREGREAWSFGPALNATTRGRYLAVDLIVREYIKDTSVWQALSWFAHFDPKSHADAAVSFAPIPGELTVIFPGTTGSYAVDGNP